MIIKIEWENNLPEQGHTFHCCHNYILLPNEDNDE